MNRKNNKRGSVTVLICMFFLSLMVLITAYISFSKAYGVKSATNALGGLWADSILAEYDLNLFNRYDLFGYYGDSSTVDGKVNFYAGEAFSGKKYIRYDGCSAGLADCSLTDLDNFREQIVEAGAFSLTNKYREKKCNIKAVYTTAGKDGEGNLFQNLPSEGRGRELAITKIVKVLQSDNSMKKLVEKGSESYFINKYINQYFKCKTDDKSLGNSYFDSEIEYIICGKKSDKSNDLSVRKKIIAIREILNFTFIKSDPKMFSEVAAAAQIITPGPGALVTEQLLTAAWAYGESVNDYRLLVKNHKIPVMKDRVTWATDLESVINNTSDGCIYTGIDKGNDYEDYLNMFLYITDEETRLYRIMDLIQINCRRFYYSGFKLSDFNHRVSFRVTVNGKEYDFDKSY